MERQLTGTSTGSVKKIAASTRMVKQSMWNKFLRWLADENIPLSALTYVHLHSFFEEEKIIKAHRQRYLRLIERVYGYLIDLGLRIKENPASAARKEKLGKGDNDPTVFLKREEKEKIEKVIQDRLRAYGGAEKKIEKEGKGRKKQSWLLVRDAAITAVMLGGGGTVGGIGKLSVNCTNCAEGKISLPREGGGSYESVLLPIGDMALQAWLRLRRQRVGIGDQVFPADIKSRSTRMVDTPTMHPSTIFRAVRNVLREAGITGARACGQTLRNTYAATLIDLGFNDQQIQECMGFNEPLSAVRLRTAYLGPSPEQAKATGLAIAATVRKR